MTRTVCSFLPICNPTWGLSYFLSLSYSFFFSLSHPSPIMTARWEGNAEHDPPLQWALVPEGVGLRKGSGNLGKNEILTHYLRICFTVGKMCAWKRKKCLALYNILPVKRNSYLFYVFERSLPCSPMLQYCVNIIKYLHNLQKLVSWFTQKYESPKVCY